ncbi:glycosyltransferase, partial [Klebsiella pneumoniae]|nr:glycosyltransferase [Klebsiella pneumoniae]
MGGKTFMLMAGGTGGHIFPALAVADSLRARGHHVIWLGSKDSMEERIVPQHDILRETLAIKGVHGNGIKRKLMLPFTLYQTVREAQRIIRKHRVECVIGFGGFVTFPGGLAAKLLGVPIVIHEQNAVAGLSNRHLSRWAKRVLYAFPKAFSHEGGLVGNPVRADISNLPVPAERFQGREGRQRLERGVLHRLFAQRRRVSAGGRLCRQPGGGSVFFQRQVQRAADGQPVFKRRRIPSGRRCGGLEGRETAGIGGKTGAMAAK